MENTINFSRLSMSDLEQVGGKNASLGEMIQNLAKAGVRVPPGFATAASAYKDFLAQNNLDQKIYSMLNALNLSDVHALSKASAEIKKLILSTPLKPGFIADVEKAYGELVSMGFKTCAVRSSANAEDSPEASFAGQQDTFLNVAGLENILLAIKKVYASLFNDRAIVYRVQNGFTHPKVAISAGIQAMVRSDLATSGVMFTLDTESGFEKAVFINASYGLGESVVQGIVNPDEFYVFKPSLKNHKFAILQRTLGSKATKIIYAHKTKATKNDLKELTTTVKVSRTQQQQFCLSDAEVQELAQYAVTIEQHYQKHMDIEWAKDGLTNELFIVQARPETVQSHGDHQMLNRYTLSAEGPVLATGHSVGQKIGQGRARIITDPKNMDTMQKGEVLIADMTDPDWEPIMKLASAIVTNRGGRTCHAAIVARELGIPAVVGCNDATTKIPAEKDITVSCASGETGYVYEGLLPFHIDHIKIQDIHEPPVKIYLNLADPDSAFALQFLPNHGVGLLRMEFIISNQLGIHPKAILKLDTLPKNLQNKILKLTAAYKNPVEFYIEKLREGISTIAAAFFPKPVIVRFSDFKSNEYANLIGGKLFEPQEENPMIGFRGASRYVSPLFADCFALECEAIKRIRNDMGLTNVEVMLPFVRTVDELKKLIDLLIKHGLKSGENALKVIMMCEIPSNAILAEQFLRYCDGFSIGSNDLTQLTLGLDRDSSLVADLFDERNDAVKALLHQAIKTCNEKQKYIGICGQAPSDYPELARWLMEEGINSLSLSPDSIVETWLYLCKNKNDEKTPENN